MGNKKLIIIISIIVALLILGLFFYIIPTVKKLKTIEQQIVKEEKPVEKEQIETKEDKVKNYIKLANFYISREEYELAR